MKRKESMMRWAIAGVLAVFIAGPSQAAGGDLAAPIIDNNGTVVGEIRARKASGGVLLDVRVKGLPPGRHGMHFHAVGDCSDHAQFQAAGPHVDPNKRPHGFLHPQGPHEGNLPNLVVHADGTAEVELYSHLVRLDEGPAALLDADGSSLIIHAEPDDHLTQPIGGSGARIACAVLSRSTPGRAPR